jgi:hypothetical protein
MEEFSWQLVLNFIAVHLIAWMECSRWPMFSWIQRNKVWVRRAVVVGFSTVTASGMVYHFEIATGDFALRGNIWDMIHALKHIAQNYTGITGMYWVKSLHEFSMFLRKRIESQNQSNTSVSPVEGSFLPGQS